MNTHFDLSDQELQTQVESGRIDQAVFNHEAHLRLAWINIDRYGVEEAILRVPEQIQSFARHTNLKDKYHHTLTVAAVKLVYSFTLISSSDNFQDFISEFPQLKHGFRELIGRHYGIDIFRSEPAKKTFLEPDLLPFY